MREMRREHEVPEAEAQVEECLDCLARITSKEVAPIHSVKYGTLQNACSTRSRVVADFGEKCSYAHRQVDEQLSERSKKNDDKSAVAMLKKHDSYDRTGNPLFAVTQAGSYKACYHVPLFGDNLPRPKITHSDVSPHLSQFCQKAWNWKEDDPYYPRSDA